MTKFKKQEPLGPSWEHEKNPIERVGTENPRKKENYKRKYRRVDRNAWLVPLFFFLFLQSIFCSLLHDFHGKQLALGGDLGGQFCQGHGAQDFKDRDVGLDLPKHPVADFDGFEGVDCIKRLVREVI